MTKGKFLRRALVAAIAFTAGCGDSTGPNVQLNDDQVDDMMVAFARAGGFSFAELGEEDETAGNALMATVNLELTADCPNGGTTTIEQSITEDEETQAFSATITQSFSGCKGTSNAPRVWTFDGNPNIVTTIAFARDPETGTGTLTGSQVGGIRFTSDLGTGTCNVNLTVSGEEDASGENGSITITGTVCGKTIDFFIGGIATE